LIHTHTTQTPHVPYHVHAWIWGGCKSKRTGSIYHVPPRKILKKCILST